MVTTRHRSLVERAGRKAFVRDLAHQKKEKYKGKNQYSRI